MGSESSQEAELQLVLFVQGTALMLGRERRCFLCFFKGIFWQMVVEEYFVTETGFRISIGGRKKDQFFEWMTLW